MRDIDEAKVCLVAVRGKGLQGGVGRVAPIRPGGMTE